METMTPFALERPASLGDAVRILANTPQARILAGGTDLVPNLRHRIDRPAVLIDLSAIDGFDRVTMHGAGLTLGAGVTLARLAEDATLAADYRALAEAAQSVAAPGHRNAATLGGNLCVDTRCVFYNHSDWWRAANGYCLKRGGTVCHVAPQGDRCHAAFCGDLAAALLALDASVEAMSVRGVRSFPLAELYRDDGRAHLTLAADEMLVRIHVPKPEAGSHSGYRKVRVRGAIDFPLAGVGCSLALAGEALAQLRIALTGTNAQPIVLAGTDAYLGQPVSEGVLAGIGKLVQKQVSPMRTTMVQANYRRQVASVLARRLVSGLAGVQHP